MTRRGTWLSAALAAALGLGGAGCDAPVAGGPQGEQAARPFRGLVVERLRVGVASAALGERDALEGALREALAGALPEVGVTLDASRPAPASRRVEMVITAAHTGAALMVELELEGDDAHGPLRLAVQAQARQAPEDGAGDAARRALARRAAQALVSALEGPLGVVRAQDAALGEALVSGQARVVLAGVHEVGRRGLAAHAPALRELLVHPDAEVSLAAIATLGLLRDASSVPLLRDLAFTSQDAQRAQQAIFALGQIGDEAAREVLGQVAAGHPHPLLRREASDALRRFERQGRP